MNAIRHVRVQHPVGHGFFHSGTLEWSGRRAMGFSYVVDCGGRGPRNGPLRRSVEQYRRWNGGPCLDLLFLTHLHSDHVNGLSLLMAEREISAVVLPYLSPFERLAIFIESRTGASDADTGPDDYRLLIDPAARLFELGARSVSYIHAGEHDGPTDRNGEGSDADGHDSFGPGVELELVPPPAFHGELYTGTGGQSFGPAPAHRRDRQPFKLRAGATFMWEFSTFVQERAGTLQRFRDELRRQLPEHWEGLEDPCTAVGTLVELIKPGRLRRGLKAAYEQAVGSDQLNRTSLTILSTPAAPWRWMPLPEALGSDLDVPPWVRCGMPWSWDPEECQKFLKRNGHWDRRRGRASSPSWWTPPGWMGLGDSELAKPERVVELVQHFGSTLAAVGTVTLPHHGSIHNYHPRLIDEVQPRCAVVSCDCGDAKHPAEPIAADLRARGVNLVRVEQSSDPLVQRFEWVM